MSESAPEDLPGAVDNDPEGISKKSSKRDRKKRSNFNDSVFHQSCAIQRDAVVGDLFSIDKLVHSKVDVNEANAAGSTALHFATQNGQTHVVVKLLAAKADPALANKFNETPLHLATKKGLDEIVFHLLRNKSPVDTVNTQDQATPLCVWRARVRVRVRACGACSCQCACVPFFGNAAS